MWPLWPHLGICAVFALRHFMGNGDFYKVLRAMCHPFPTLVSDTEYSYFTKSGALTYKYTASIKLLCMFAA